MKLKSFAILSLIVSAAAIGRAQEVKLNLPGQPGQAAPSGAAAAAAPAPSFTEAQLVEEFGWFIGKRVGLTELSFSPAEIAQLVKGLSAAASGKESPYELEKVGPAMDEFMQKKQNAYLSKLKEQNNAEATKFFADLKANNKDLVELPSGLRYQILKPGSGPTPKPTETVKVHYTGTLINGEVFDSSVQRGEPAEFPLDQVIPGWTEGIQKIQKGGKIKLFVPANLAYGDDGRPGIPPASTLIFEVELLDIKPTPPQPAADAAPAGK